MSYPFCADSDANGRDLIISRDHWPELEAQARQIADLQIAVENLRERTERKVGDRSPLGWAAKQFLWSFVGLLTADIIIIWQFDLNTIFLRLASIAIPMLSAMSYPSRHRPHLALMLGIAAVLGVSSVISMSALTAWQEHISIFPRTVHEAHLVVEYMCSIALSFVTGDLIARSLAQHHLSGQAARFIKVLDIKHDILEWRLSITAKVIEIGTAIVTGIIALVTGIQSLIG